MLLEADCWPVLLINEKWSRVEHFMSDPSHPPIQSSADANINDCCEQQMRDNTCCQLKSRMQANHPFSGPAFSARPWLPCQRSVLASPALFSSADLSQLMISNHPEFETREHDFRTLAIEFVLRVDTRIGLPRFSVGGRLSHIRTCYATRSDHADVADTRVKHSVLADAGTMLA
jgi:hypothetical protein